MVHAAVDDQSPPAAAAAVQFGRWLRQAREERSITQQALAGQAGFSRSYLSDLERGRGVRPALPTLEGLAAALGVPVVEAFAAAGMLPAPARGPARQDEDRLLALYRGVSDDGRSMIDRFVRFIYGEEQRWVQPALSLQPDALAPPPVHPAVRPLFALPAVPLAGPER